MSKLYTREQMIDAFSYGKTLEPFDCFDDFIESLTPIELPSDEEIENLGGSGMHPAYIGGVKEGAKWMRDKIKGVVNEKEVL